MILADPHHEPKVRQGVTTELVGVDGLSYAPFPNPSDLEAMVHMNAGPRRRPARRRRRARNGGRGRRSRSTGRPSRTSWPVRHGTAVNVAHARRQHAAPDRGPRLGRRAGDARGDRATSDHDSARRWRRAPSGVSSGLDYPPGAYATTDELAELANEAAKLGGIYHTHVRYSPRRPLPRPVPRGDRDRPARRGAGPHHPLLPPPDVPRHARPDARPRRRRDAPAARTSRFDAYPYEWASTRLLILIPIWVQAGGPAKTKERLADRGGPGADPRRPDEARGQLFAGRGRPPRHPASATCDGPENLRWEGRTLGELIDDRGKRPGRRPVRPAPRRGPPPERGHAGPAHSTGSAASSATRAAMVGTDSVVRRRQAEPADLRQLPADPRPVRPRRGAPRARGGDPPDDVRAGRAPRAPRPRHDPRRRGRATS